MEKYCQNCHQPNSSDASFCRHCATPLSAGQNYQQGGAGNFQGAGNFVPQTGGGTSSRATAALILVICGFLCCGPVTGVPASILGWLEMTAINEGRAPSSGMTFAKIGVWGGIGVSILGVIGYFVLFIMSVGMSY